MPESDSIPGTIHLVDVQCNLRVRHAGGGEDDIVLDPAPSDDPNDPLNWMPRRKLLSLVCQNFAYVSSNVEWIAKCIIQGFFVAPIESLPEISVTDIYFTHQRGTYIGIYALALAGSNYFAPVISGFIAEYQGWQWVVYWPAIFLSVVFVFLFLFMEETNYIRVARDINRPQIETTRASDENTSKTGEKEAEGGNQEVKEADETAQEYAKPKTFVQKMSLWHPFPGQSMARHAGRSIEYLSWPVIFFAGFSYGSYLIWFNPSMVGLSYLSCCIGTIIAFAVAGRMSDWLTVKLARRNNGIMEAEHRLWPLAICVVGVPASLILWGVGAQHGVHWFGLIFAMCALSTTSVIGLIISINYLIDSYYDISGDAITTIILVRNTMSFAISYGITPWITNLGYQNCFVSAAFVALAACSAVFVIIKYGKALRVRTASRYHKLVADDKRVMGVA
ncbi:unnamed protein product [Fusarium venenatum]|uniref:Major facilitator superfamily (MFS) profile domain-containing protein n=1 Tax=Fusarium venenatum TaxID=56646 RepID=A0A2L2SW07_9HYPO|nr:uncharacterized protein FVRRES_06290 [Fusarium venenatum]CEI61854.1 unnamed protein product [Fusarium venenatum]